MPHTRPKCCIAFASGATSLLGCTYWSGCTSDARGLPLASPPLVALSWPLVGLMRALLKHMSSSTTQHNPFHFLIAFFFSISVLIARTTRFTEYAIQTHTHGIPTHRNTINAGMAPICKFSELKNRCASPRYVDRLDYKKISLCCHNHKQVEKNRQASEMCGVIAQVCANVTTRLMQTISTNTFTHAHLMMIRCHVRLQSSSPI